MTATVEAVTTGVAAYQVPTLAAQMHGHAVDSPDHVVMREKDFGVWKESTAAEIWELVLDAAHGLLALGVEIGDRVSIQSENRPEWMILDFATIAVRGITVGFYPTNPTAEVEYLLGDCGSVVHLAEDQEQVDRVLEIDRAAVSNVRKVLYCEPRGVRQYDDERLLGWDEFLALGREHRDAHRGAVEELMSEAKWDDGMTLVYTSGTTGPPKGAMLTHRNVTYSMSLFRNPAIREGFMPSMDDEILCYLPLCHVAERIFSTFHVAEMGLTVNFAESIDTVQANLREVQPTLFFAVPRIWEKIHAGVMIRASDATPFKRLWWRFGVRLAVVIGREKVANGGLHTVKSRLLDAIGRPLVFRALLERIGLRRCKWAGTGAAPIAPEILEFFTGVGVPVYELYGMTENSAIATVNVPGRMKLGTVGEPFGGVQLPDSHFRIDEATGEIQVKHPGVFAGYWNKPEQTAETFTDDGWLKTGDVGEWVDGTHVRIVDRIKHIIITSGGKNISPSEIENSLKASPYIKEAMVIGDRRKFLTALIGIELDTVGNWALRKGVPYTTYRDLGEKPEVQELIQGVVNETNGKFASVETIKRFRMIPKELDHEDGELTATQKLKRNAMEDMFGELIEEMYA
ncbi:MAG: long-chain fatty acid--CoA ligase [Verrucomicrobiales bacterium]|nr:long-chain fatty acid--CoA ligase [Verrucomicrobiales bacterium]